VRRPIRRQILIPFSLTLLAAVGTIAVSAAWLAARRSEQQSLRELNGVLSTLASSSLTYNESILEKIHGLSGVELVALDSAGRPVFSTAIDLDETLIKEASKAPLITGSQSFSDFPRVTSGEDHYFAARLRADGAARVATLLVLYPEASWSEERWAAAWPPLVVGAVTLSIVFVISAWLAARIGRRIGEVEELLARIANGHFEDTPARSASEGSEQPSDTASRNTALTTDSPPLDELDALVRSAQKLSRQLVKLQDEIRHTEQVRLLAQLAGGLAHQLRNAVTGARLAIQLHERRCNNSDDESLSVALRQLTLTEQQIRGLLSLGRKETREPEAASVSDLIVELEQLLQPHAAHAHVDLRVTSPTKPADVSDGEAFRLATLNLTLNAIEAAGAGGSVSVDCRFHEESVCVEVADSGDGPPPEIGESLFEPFVTSRPEGVGLGLALVRQAAERAGGSIEWQRRNNLTVFELTIPTHPVPSPLGGEGARRADEGAAEQPSPHKEPADILGGQP
jgi:signal transduction histidine kinase